MFRLLGAFTLIVALAAIDVRPVSAAESRLPEFLKKFELGQIFPGADRYGPVEGRPPAAAAFGGDRLLGYVYLNADVVNSTGYSGKPINIVVGIDLNGKIVGLQLAEHHEPIVLVGIPPAKITAFLEGYIGRNFLTPTVNNAAAPVDIISGATVTVMVIADSLTRSAIRIARSRGLGTALAALAPAAPAAVKKINDAHNQPEDWNALLADGSIGRLSITIGEINDAFAKSGTAAAAEHPEGGPASDSFIELYAARPVPSIGRSLLGDAGYNQLKQRLKPGQQAIIVAGKGRYSFKGSGYVRGGIFDRIQLVQGENSIRFHDHDHVRLGDLMAEGAPEFPEISLFTIPATESFDPAAPWRLKLLAQRAIGGRDKAFLTYDLNYALPDKYLTVEKLAVTVAVPEAAASANGKQAAPSAANEAAEPAQSRFGSACGATGWLISSSCAPRSSSSPPSFSSRISSCAGRCFTIA